MAQTATLRIKTAAEIDFASEYAELSILLSNEADAYTIRVEPLTDDERETYDSSTHAVRDGYTEDSLHGSFDEALTVAWRAFIDTQTQNLEDAQP